MSETIRGLSSSQDAEGFYRFYWNGHDVTGHWMSFFSGLTLKDEKYSAYIYAKRHGKELNQKFPYTTPQSKNTQEESK